MDKINIFTATTIKGPSKQEAVGHFIIELMMPPLLEAGLTARE